MKAFIYEKYGPPETFRTAEVEKPSRDADEVLVKVLGISVNAADWHVLQGKPLFSRATTLGLLRPNHQILGVDIAGRVEAVGSGATPVQARRRGLCQLLRPRIRRLCRIRFGARGRHDLEAGEPVSFEEAAAVPMAGVTALQAYATTEPSSPPRRS
jgi:NADPH:quinone reductase-like Zn-dependent oxidoreductase